MKLNPEPSEKIAKYLLWQRGNMSLSNLELGNAILSVTENGCQWRALPESYGNWHTVYVRMRIAGARTAYDSVFRRTSAGKYDPYSNGRGVFGQNQY